MREKDGKRKNEEESRGTERKIVVQGKHAKNKSIFMWESCHELARTKKKVVDKVN